MARKISDFNGTKIAPGGAYPSGDIKDNPSGTIIDRVSNADIHQFFQKSMRDFSITPNGLADNETNGYQYFYGVQGIANAFAKEAIISRIGVLFDNTKVYVLRGCEARGSNGYILFDDVIYYVSGEGGPSCFGGLIDVLAISSPITTFKGLPVVNVVCGTSGTGISDFADLIYISGWQDAGATSFVASGGGSVTVDLADIQYNKYTMNENTVTYQLYASSVTVTGTVSSILVDFPFLTSGTPVASGRFPVGYTSSDGVIVGQVGALGITIFPSSGSNFATGTNNKELSINITFEIEP